MRLIGQEALNTYRFRSQTPKCPALEQYYISGMNFPARPSLYVKPSIIRAMGRVESKSLTLLEKQ